MDDRVRVGEVLAAAAERKIRKSAEPAVSAHNAMPRSAAWGVLETPGPRLQQAGTPLDYMAGGRKQDLRTKHFRRQYSSRDYRSGSAASATAGGRIAGGCMHVGPQKSQAGTRTDSRTCLRCATRREWATCATSQQNCARARCLCPPRMPPAQYCSHLVQHCPHTHCLVLNIARLHRSLSHCGVERN